MSDYCTNCTHLSKQNVANETKWRCSRNVVSQGCCYDLVLLCGNATKLHICKIHNWFKHKEKQMTTQEMVAVMQAYLDGKTIQFLDDGDKWEGCTIKPNWNWRDMSYRIKPEPKYRPYNGEEMKALIGKQVVCREYTTIVTVYNSDANTIYVNPYGWFSASYLLGHAKMLDGSPCGVEE